jgi:predicted transcriptional regulators
MPFVAFKMTNNIAFNKLNAPDWGILVAGGILSAIGMLVGIRIGRLP